MKTPKNTIKLLWIFFGASILCSYSAYSFSDSFPIRYNKKTFSIGDEHHDIKIAEGYSLKVLNRNLEQPRIIFRGQNNSLYIGSRSGYVYQLDPPYKTEKIVAHLNDYPHSVVVRDNTILIAQTNGVYKAKLNGQNTIIRDDGLELVVKLPGGPGHNSRTLKSGPDGKLYLSLGISGNCSHQLLSKEYPFEKRRGGVIRISPDEPEKIQVYTSGLRNPIGFDWHPGTGNMYVTNNGPDHLGYDQPPEYFSKVSQGDFHGMPWYQYNGEKLIRDDCIEVKPPAPKEEVILPEATFPARSAPMDMIFVGTNHPDQRLKGNTIVALHGSWATKPFGTSLGLPSTKREPKIVLVKFENKKATKVLDFVTGFQTTLGSRWCRPMGLALVNQDIVFTCDAGNEGLYMLEYEKQ